MAAVENMVKIVDNLSNNEHKKGDNCLDIALRDNEAFNCKNITKLSHKLWRRLWKKEKRRKIRQQMAKEFELLEKEEQIKLGLTTSEAIEANRKQEEWRSFLEEKKRQKLHEEWLEREKVAQDEFKRQRTEEERRRQERLDQEKRIKDEWEKQERVEKDRKEHKEKKAKERENNLTKELEKSGIIKSTTDEENWHNPIAEVIPEKSKLYGTEQDPNNCAFYLKTGACRFGERCSRQHPRPENSKTLLIPNMFQDVRLTETMLDEKNQDAGLEFDEDELYQNFREFYKDVVSEFKSCGDLYQFKVCSNFEQHLRGNVYVQYFSEDDALKAFSKFNGRWYAGKQLSVQFSPVTKWKSAICGTFARNCCPRGKNCNFLHVFRNPKSEFSEADRDAPPARDRKWNMRHNEREWRSSTRELERRWERADSQYSERGSQRRERRSERATPSRRRRSRSGSRDRSRRSREKYDRSRSRSRDRTQSRSRDRTQSRRSSRREKHRSKSRDRESKSLRRSISHDKTTQKNQCSSVVSLGSKKKQKRQKYSSDSSSDGGGNNSIKTLSRTKTKYLEKCASIIDSSEEPEFSSD